MTRPSLPRSVTWLARRIIPAQSRAGVLDDLADDYARASHGHSTFGARWWLIREASSLLIAYSVSPITSLKGSWPMWVRDVRLVVRGLRRGPVAALGAAAMLSTGLVAVLLTAGLAKTLLFRNVSATHGDSLHRIAAVDRQGHTILRLSFVELQLIRDRLTEAGTVASVNMQPIVLDVHGSTAQTMAEVVDGNYFALTGMTTVIGRGILSTDDRAESQPIAVLAESFWRRRFAASPSVLGQPIKINGEAYTVVGVASALGSSSFLGASVDAWVPVAHADPLLNRGWRTNIENRWFTSFVLPTTSVAEIDARLAAAASDLARIHPDPWRERRLQTTPATMLAGSQRATVTMLVGILAALALLILTAAASNVGGLLLARAVTMRRQIAIHLSMGSGRRAIIRRQLIEGALLGTAASAIAVGLYTWTRTWLAEIAVLPTLALRLDLPLDPSLIATVLGAGVAVGVLLALGPAVWATRVQLADAIRGSDLRTGHGRGLLHARRVLVSAQVCLSLALIIGAVLFSRSLSALMDADLGFPRERLVAMDFDVEPAGPPMSEFPALARQALDRAEATSGVVAAAMSNRAPIDQPTPSLDVRMSAAEGSTISDVTFYLATTRYFETVGVPVVSGRAFTAAETDAAADVVIINETLARRLWPGGDALERSLYLASEAKTVRVVGIARDSKYRSISEAPRPHLYRPTPPALGLTLLAKTSSDPRQTLRSLQQTLDRVGPGIVGFFPRTITDHLAIELLPTRAAAGAATLLGALALIFSAVGLYGLVSWFVELRRREIGVRMSLGAGAGAVRRLVVRQALSAALPGIVAGMLLSGGLGLLARGALYGVGPLDPSAFAAGIGSLVVVVAFAAYVPSRRATRVDPATVMRNM
jgi:predicted permease